MRGMKTGVWYSGVTSLMPSLFVETAYNSNAVWLDPVYEGEPKSSKPVTFGSDQQGIYSPESGGLSFLSQGGFFEVAGPRGGRFARNCHQAFCRYPAVYSPRYARSG